MRIAIDPASSVPPFEQLRAGLAARIRGGELLLGERLPTVRGMAEELGVAPNTVARAYRELEAAGLVATRGRNGTLVDWSADDAERDLQQAASAYAERVRALGADPAAALRAVERALRGGTAE